MNFNGGPGVTLLAETEEESKFIDQLVLEVLKLDQTNLGGYLNRVRIDRSSGAYFDNDVSFSKLWIGFLKNRLIDLLMWMWSESTSLSWLRI